MALIMHFSCYSLTCISFLLKNCIKVSGVQQSDSVSDIYIYIYSDFFSIIGYIPPSSRDEGLRLLHGLATNLATSLQTPQEA